jgi:hypothetical protein
MEPLYQHRVILRQHKPSRLLLQQLHHPRRPQHKQQQALQRQPLRLQGRQEPHQYQQQQQRLLQRQQLILVCA